MAFKSKIIIILYTVNWFFKEENDKNHDVKAEASHQIGTINDNTIHSHKFLSIKNK